MAPAPRLSRALANPDALSRRRAQTVEVRTMLRREGTGSSLGSSIRISGRPLVRPPRLLSGWCSQPRINGAPARGLHAFRGPVLHARGTRIWLRPSGRHHARANPVGRRRALGFG